LRTAQRLQGIHHQPDSIVNLAPAAGTKVRRLEHQTFKVRHHILKSLSRLGHVLVGRMSSAPSVKCQRHALNRESILILCTRHGAPLLGYVDHGM
jgi:hypothetical protein